MLKNLKISRKLVTGDKRKNCTFVNIRYFKISLKIPRNGSKQSGITFFHENKTLELTKSYLKKKIAVKSVTGDKSRNRNFRQFFEISKFGSKFFEMFRN